MKRLVIYHGGGCFDGFCAAWLYSKAFPDAEFFPAVYGQAPPDVRDRDVTIVDFSYKLDVMVRLAQEAGTLAVLDHHKSAVDELADFHAACDAARCRCSPFVDLQLEKSGGRLAWEHLYGRMLLPDDWLTTSRSGYSLGFAPWLVDYTEDRDLWRWALPESRELNAALRSYEMTFGQWDLLHDAMIHVAPEESFLVDEGEAIIRMQEQTVATHVRNAREIVMDGYRVLCVNATTCVSEIGQALAEDRPFAASYFDRADGLRVWSLRSSAEGGIDVSEIARKRGGGGHKHAAGFEERVASVNW